MMTGILQHRLHVLGKREYSILVRDGKLVESIGLEDELTESSIPEDYGYEHGGFLMRSLTEYSLYYEDGTPAPLESLDSKGRHRIVAFGTVLPPDYRPATRGEPKKTMNPPFAPTPAPVPLPAPIPTPRQATGSISSPSPIPSAAASRASDVTSSIPKIKLSVKPFGICVNPQEVADSAAGNGSAINGKPKLSLKRPLGKAPLAAVSPALRNTDALQPPATLNGQADNGVIRLPRPLNQQEALPLPSASRVIKLTRPKTDVPAETSVSAISRDTLTSSPIPKSEALPARNGPSPSVVEGPSEPPASQQTGTGPAESEASGTIRLAKCKRKTPLQEDSSAPTAKIKLVRPPPAQPEISEPAPSPPATPHNTHQPTVPASVPENVKDESQAATHKLVDVNGPCQSRPEATDKPDHMQEVPSEISDSTGSVAGEEEHYDSLGLRVCLPETTEWCIDYTDGKPVLWLITPSAWYRIFDTNHPFIRPHPLYRRIFNTAFLRYKAAGATARSLLQVHRSNPDADYDTVLDHIYASYKGRLSEDSLLENADFIATQMAGVRDPMGTYVTFDQCPFVKGLRSRARSMGIRGLNKKERELMAKEHASIQAQVVQKWLLALENPLYSARCRAALAKLREKRQAKAAEAAACSNDWDSRAADVSGQDDLDLLREEAAIPRPEPEPASRLLPPALFSSLLTIWATIHLCGTQLLRLSPFSLSELEEAVVDHLHKGLCPNLISELTHRLLTTILAEKDQGRPVAVNVASDFEEEREMRDKDSARAPRPVETTESILYRGTFAVNLLPFGWQELTRLLIATQRQIPLVEYLDPLAEIQRILEDFQTDKKVAAPFFHKIDTVAIPTYLNMISEPMDLGTILSRLRTGYYEEPETGRSCARFPFSSTSIVTRGPWLKVPKPKPSPPPLAPTSITAQADNTGCQKSADKTEEVKEKEEEDDEDFEKGGVADTPDTGTSRTKAKGARGVIEDINLVWSNCEKFNGTDAPLTEAAQSLAEELEDLLTRRIVEPLDKRDRALGRLPPLSRLTSSSPRPEEEEEDHAEWLEVVRQLGSLPFEQLSVETRVKVLRWLADEIMSTNALRMLLDQTEGAKIEEKKYGMRRRTWLAQQSGYGQQAIPGPAGSLWTEQDEKAYEQIKQAARGPLRLQSLGTDRYRRRYFVFPEDETRGVFTEAEANGPLAWVYRDREAILGLIRWLSSNSPRESFLKRRLAGFVKMYHKEEEMTKEVNGQDTGEAEGMPSAAGRDHNAQNEETQYMDKHQIDQGAVNGGHKDGAEDSSIGCKRQALTSSLSPKRRKRSDYRIYVNELRPAKTAGPYLVCKSLLFPIGITEEEKTVLGLRFMGGEFLLSFFKQPPEKKAPTKECPYPRMGLFLQDRIVQVNGQLTNSPTWPQVQQEGGVRKTEEGHPENWLLHVFRDSESGAQIDPGSLPDRVTVASEWAYVQAYLLGLESSLHYPFSMGADWDGFKRTAWRATVIKGVHGEGLSQAVLELEATLKAKGVCLVKEDKDGRARGVSAKWRQFVLMSRTPSQMLLALRTLDCLVDRRPLGKMLAQHQREEWIAGLPSERRVYIPERGDIVVYYTDGHKEALKHNHRFRAPLWGISPPNDKGGKAKVQVCLVEEVTYHGLPNAKDIFAASYWAKVKLKRLSQPPQVKGNLRLYRSLEPRAPLSRLFARVVTTSMAMKEADQFCQPVDEESYPDYYETIKSPMDLGTLMSRVRRHAYGSLEAFREDLELISRNCHAYCDDRYPTLPPLCDQVINVARQILLALEPKIKVAEKEVTCLAARANLWEQIPPCAPAVRRVKKQQVLNPVSASASSHQPPPPHLSVNGSPQHAQPPPSQTQSLQSEQTGIPSPENPATGSFLQAYRQQQAARAAAQQRQQQQTAAQCGIARPDTNSGYTGQIATNRPSPGLAYGATPGAYSYLSSSQPSPAAFPPGSTPVHGPSPATYPYGHTPLSRGSPTAHPYSLSTPGVSSQASQHSPAGTPHVRYTPTSPAFSQSGQHSHGPLAHATARTAIYRDPRVLETLFQQKGECFYTGIWLTNAVPEFIVRLDRLEESMEQVWRKESGFSMSWSSPMGKTYDIGLLYEGTITGIRPPDPVTQLPPWEAFQVEWTTDPTIVGYANPWTISTLPSQSRCLTGEDIEEYCNSAVKATHIHAHTLLDIPVGTRPRRKRLIPVQPHPQLVPQQQSLQQAPALTLEQVPAIPENHPFAISARQQGQDPRLAYIHWYQHQYRPHMQQRLAFAQQQRDHHSHQHNI